MERLPFALEAFAPGERPIVGDVRVPAGSGIAPVVAIAHDWLGWKDAGFLPVLAEALAEGGLVAVSFSFSGSGVSAGRDEIVDDAAFAENTFLREVADVGRIVTAIFERMLPGRERFDIARIGVLGYGTGASVAALEAARDTRVKALGLLNGHSRLAAALPPEALDAYFSRGEWTFRDPRTNRPLTVGAPLFRELRARAQELDVPAAIEEVRAPILILHATDDARAPFVDARALFFANSDRADIEPLRGADHELRPVAAAAGEGAADPVRAACAVAARFFGERLGRRNSAA